MLKRFLKWRRDKIEERDVDKRLRALRRRQLKIAEHRQRVREIEEIERIDQFEPDYEDEIDYEDEGNIEDIAIRNLLEKLFGSGGGAVAAPVQPVSSGQGSALIELSDAEVGKIIESNKKYLKKARHLPPSTIEKLIRAQMPNMGHDTITRAIQQIKSL